VMTAEGNEVKKRGLIVACIPAYNEEKSIARVVLQTAKLVDRVIVCDDGSSDMTAEIAGRLGAEVIRHERNMGYGSALASLFRRAREIGPEAMVTLDADCQHNPAEIPKLLEPVLKGKADVVIGSRFLGSDEVMPGYRKAGVKAITRLTNFANHEEISDAQSGFRAYGNSAIQLITPAEQGMGASTEILLKAKDGGLRIMEVPIKINYEMERPSTQNPIYHGVDVVLSTVKHLSMRHPLLFYGTPGLVALSVAIIFWIWTFQIFAETRQVVTNVALVAIGATLVGLMLLTTAVILWVLVSVVREMR